MASTLRIPEILNWETCRDKTLKPLFRGALKNSDGLYPAGTPGKARSLENKGCILALRCLSEHAVMSVNDEMQPFQKVGHLLNGSSSTEKKTALRYLCVAANMGERYECHQKGRYARVQKYVMESATMMPSVQSFNLFEKSSAKRRVEAKNWPEIKRMKEAAREILETQKPADKTLDEFINKQVEDFISKVKEERRTRLTFEMGTDPAIREQRRRLRRMRIALGGLVQRAKAKKYQTPISYE